MRYREEDVENREVFWKKIAEEKGLAHEKLREPKEYLRKNNELEFARQKKNTS